MTGVRFDPAELAGIEPSAWAGCDFCARARPRWVYPARAAVLGGIVVDGQRATIVVPPDWTACSECARLIEAGDWPVLARRTLESMDLPRISASLRVRFLSQISHSQAAFRRARGGPRRRLDRAVKH